jgi:hypothetical protein
MVVPAPGVVSSLHRHAASIRQLVRDDAYLLAFFEAAYDEVLVVRCQAPWSHQRWDFLHHHMAQDFPATEYRFQGNLGFGGKFRTRSDLQCSVTCYAEDETPARLETIARANEALKALRARFVQDHSSAD